MPKYKTEKLLKKKKLRRYWCTSITAVFVIVALYGISFWSDHESVNIKKLTVEGAKFTEPSFSENIFNELKEGSFLFILSRDNLLFLPRNRIENLIEENVAIKHANVKMPRFDEAIIEITEHEPFGIWCDLEGVCYFVNNKGFIFLEKDMFVMDNLINLKGNLEGNIVGSQFVDEKIFRNFVDTISLLEQIDVEISEISTEDFESFSLVTIGGPYLLMDKADDPSEVVSNLKTTLEQESINEIQFENLEYIDLRFEGKAYYKIK